MTSANERPRTPGTTNDTTTSKEQNMSPKSASSPKVLFSDPGSISPAPKDKHREPDQSETLDHEKSSKHFRASMAKKRLSGRPSLEHLAAVTKSSLASNPSISSILSEDPEASSASPKHHRHAYDRLSKQVTTWIQQEKVRRASRRAKKTINKAISYDTSTHEQAYTDHGSEISHAHDRRASDSSEGSTALDNLANILERTLSLKSNESSPRKRRSSHHSHHSHSHRSSLIMKRPSGMSSDTDYFEGAEELVPACEAVLDNTKTMAYSGGSPDSGEEDDISSKAGRRAMKEKEAWATFKFEILRITHTLKLKGWRRVPPEQSNEIEVERLSGALTNAVYVVSPPKNMRPQAGTATSLPTPKNLPPKLLLRIYGPQVEHLIDREEELQILRRLARKRIGPRMLGTFTNGRFEEFFHAQTLTFHDLRVPETSKQIAKRMRELHEGIDLLRKEREGGPFVWRNWDKWVERCEQIVTWLDQQIKENKDGSASESWKQKGLICGAEWPLFRRTVEKYRTWLEEQYGGINKVNQRLVFAHNDTQYGNILRLMPAGESPLLLPANEHKQLVVIDFEYANANLPGLEFANHFTEWCYNYHTEVPHVCNTKYYPTPEEQSRFIRAYLVHNPTFKAPGGSASNPPTPYLGPIPSSGSTTALAATAAPSSISAFMLDSRAPPGEKYSYKDEEAQHNEWKEMETKRLMAETRLWRIANSAQWTLWGIMQAKLPDMPDFDKDEEETEQDKALDSATLEMEAVAEAEAEAGASAEAEQPPAEDEEFDYLAFAQDRAMFLWGDALQLGIIKAEDLPEELRNRVKVVEY